MFVHVLWSSYKGQKSPLDPFELELQAVVGQHVVLGTQPGSSERTASTFKS